MCLQAIGNRVTRTLVNDEAFATELFGRLRNACQDKVKSLPAPPLPSHLSAVSARRRSNRRSCRMFRFRRCRPDPRGRWSRSRR